MVSEAPAAWLRPAGLPPGIGMLMTTRQGGYSSGLYASMNTSLAVGDDRASVDANRRLLEEACGAVPVFLDQVHGTRVVTVTLADADAAPQVADASMTTEPGVACVVHAADCLPVLFAAPGGRAVAAAHAGWRGLAEGVLAATVDAVCSAGGCRPAELYVWLGACIGPRMFEVGADVPAAFGHDEATLPTARFRPGARPGKWLADLPGLAADALKIAGVAAVHGGHWCTLEDPLRFFSYRRDGVTGRMAAAIWTEPGR